MKKGKQLIRFDWAMKKMLRNKANFDILEGFLSELLKETVTIIRILESEGNKDDKDDKYNRVDIFVETGKGEHIIVEIQNSKEYDYFHRILYGTSKVITEYIDSGEEYAKVKKVISVTIAYFDLGQGEDYVYHGITQFKGIHKGDVLNLAQIQKDTYRVDDVHEVYPEYWIIKVSQFKGIIQDKLDEWIYFLKNSALPENYSAKGLSEAKEKLDEMNMTDKEKAIYKAYLKDLRDIASAQHTKMIDAKLEKERQRKLAEAEKKSVEAEKKTKEAEKKFKEAQRKLEQNQKETIIGLDKVGVPTDKIAQALKIPEARVIEILQEYKSTK